jgi:hypothetical protein
MEHPRWCEQADWDGDQRESARQECLTQTHSLPTLHRASPSRWVRVERAIVSRESRCNDTIRSIRRPLPYPSSGDEGSFAGRPSLRLNFWRNGPAGKRRQVLHGQGGLEVAAWAPSPSYRLAASTSHAKEDSIAPGLSPRPEAAESFLRRRGAILPPLALPASRSLGALLLVRARSTLARVGTEGEPATDAIVLLRGGTGYGASTAQLSSDRCHWLTKTRSSISLSSLRHKSLNRL